MPAHVACSNYMLKKKAYILCSYYAPSYKLMLCRSCIAQLSRTLLIFIAPPQWWLHYADSRVCHYWN